MTEQTSTKDQPPSPTRTDQSSESEGRPVREKLKETRIDAQASSDLPPNSDQPMNDITTNGTRGDHSTSGSDSERGRLRRKRSRENFEADQEETKHPEKKQERHVRKKSRDVTSPHESDFETATKPETRVPPISEKDGDETMLSSEASANAGASSTDRETTPEASVSGKDVNSIASPKNKRTREQAEAGTQAIADSVTMSKDSTATLKAEDERTTKRPRDGADPEAAAAKESKTKVPAAFTNTSATSPFGALTPKPKATEVSTKDQPQTSDTAFKNSGFGAFSSSSASPFSMGGSGTKSPFGAASSTKLSSFASATSTSAATPSGFGSLGASSGQSTFSGVSNGTKPASTGFGAGFGSSSAFGNVGGGSKLSSFGSGSGITGLTKKPGMPFGAREVPQESDNEEDSQTGDDGDENGDDNDNADSERRTSQALFQAQGTPETGEENEDAIWTGRAKLYTLAGEASKKSWQERGVGPFKLNVTREAPVKARFVLRADGTHRLLLNAAVMKTMRFEGLDGGDPKDGRLLFTAPTAAGEVESHQLKLKPDRATDLWNTVEMLKQSL